MLENYVVIDLEMTGLDPVKDKILEIGAVRVKNHKVEATFEQMVNPHLKLSDKVVEITGISNEMAAAGVEADDAVQTLMEFCSEMILVGHHVISDYSFLKQSAVNQKLKFEKNGVDTLKIARKLLPELPKKNLEALCEYYQIEQRQQHRALDDARVTGLLLERLITEYGELEPKVFEPYPLLYKAKKQSPITEKQKLYLNQLAEYHKINLDVAFDQMTKSDASRLVDKLILQYGRMK